MLLGDEFIDEDEPLLPAMIDLQARTGGIVLAFVEVPERSTGTASPLSSRPRRAGRHGELVRVTGLVEKPAPEEAPSNLAVIGRYVLPAASSTRSSGPSRAAAERSS